LLRARASGALRAGGREHHEPGAAAPARRDRAAVAEVGLLSARRPRAGRRDLPVRRRDQLPRDPDGQLSGARERLLVALDSHAGARAGPRDRPGAEPPESVARSPPPGPNSRIYLSGL